jgi:hypothetical protein
MSRSVRRTEVLPVPVCPTVQSKQRFHPWKESIRPLGVNALDCSILRWLSPCFLPMRSCFYPWSFAKEPTETRFNCQGAVDRIAYMYETSRTTFPLYEQDKQALRAIKEHYGVGSDAEAMRIALRETWRRITTQAQSQPISPQKDSHSSPP